MLTSQSDLTSPINYIAFFPNTSLMTAVVQICVSVVLKMLTQLNKQLFHKLKGFTAKNTIVGNLFEFLFFRTTIIFSSYTAVKIHLEKE